MKDKKEKILDKSLKLLQKFSKQKVSEEDLTTAENKSVNLKEKVTDFKLLLSMFKDGISGGYPISKTTLAVLAGVILYVVSPIDTIPDLFPMIGWTDDITVVIFVVNRLSHEIRNYKKWRTATGKNLTLPESESFAFKKGI